MCKGEKSSKLPKLQRPPGRPGTARHGSLAAAGTHAGRPGLGRAAALWGRCPKAARETLRALTKRVPPTRLKWERDLRVSLL